MQHESLVDKRGYVSFPEFTGERIYMKRFTPKDDMGRWNRTIEQMLKGVEYDHAFLMVDQGFVIGQPQRRPGLHIDGWWNDGTQDHGHPEPSHNHSRIEAHTLPPAPRWDTSPNWITGGEQREEGIFLASNNAGCRFFEGKFNGDIGEGGDCSHIDTRWMSWGIMDERRCYAGNVTMLHESITPQRPGLRTLVRINVPHWRPQ